MKLEITPEMVKAAEAFHRGGDLVGELARAIMNQSLASEEARKPPCPQYFGVHSRRCLLKEGHAGECTFQTKESEILLPDDRERATDRRDAEPPRPAASAEGQHTPSMSEPPKVGEEIEAQRGDGELAKFYPCVVDERQRIGGRFPGFWAQFHDGVREWYNDDDHENAIHWRRKAAATAEDAVTMEAIGKIVLELRLNSLPSSVDPESLDVGTYVHDATIADIRANVDRARETLQKRIAELEAQLRIAENNARQWAGKASDGNTRAEAAERERDEARATLQRRTELLKSGIVDGMTVAERANWKNNVKDELRAELAKDEPKP